MLIFIVKCHKSDNTLPACYCPHWFFWVHWIYSYKLWTFVFHGQEWSIGCCPEYILLAISAEDTVMIMAFRDMNLVWAEPVFSANFIEGEWESQSCSVLLVFLWEWCFSDDGKYFQIWISMWTFVFVAKIVLWQVFECWQLELWN